MNERIKELAEQAGYTKGHHDEYGRLTVMPEFNKEKFAELIVRECIDTARNAKSLEAAVMIKQHFGVSE